MPKAKTSLEIYDPYIWQSRVAKRRYYLNDGNQQDQMLDEFIGIQTKPELSAWVDHYGRPDSTTNRRSADDYFYHVKKMHWLIKLFNASLNQSYTSDEYLKEHLIVNPYQYGLIALTQFERDELVEYKEIDYVLSDEDKKTQKLLRAKIEQFKSQYTVVGFQHDSLPIKISLAITKRTWKNTIEQIRLIARVTVARNVGFEIAQGSNHGQLSADISFDPKSEMFSLIPDIIVKNPWQAMNYALYKRILQSKKMPTCHYCGKPITAQRSTAKFCKKPKTCKDDYNNRIRRLGG